MQCSKFALFLGDLSMHCNEADLEEAFAPYGTILEIRVKRSKETAKTLSYGFLEFASASSAVNAMNDMDGAVLKGRPLRIRWAASKKNPVRKRDIREDLSDRISMHVKFMSYKIEKVITEELLRNLFSIYGEVSDTTIKQISIDRKSHRLKGYGFVSYFNDEAGYMAAQRALTELHDTTLDDVTYKCELSNIIDSTAPQQGMPPPGSPYLAPNMNMGMGMHGAPVLGLTPQSSTEFDFESAAQASYYDDYANTPDTIYANGLEMPSFEKSTSGGPMLMRESTATTNASMSSSSSKFPSRSSSLEKDGLSPGALDFRTPLMVEDAPRVNHFAPTMSTFGRSPGRAAISASPLLSSYQVGAPLTGGPVGGPRPAPVQRPYHYNQAPPQQQQGQYPSQSRYQPNRESGYPSPQLSHLGVAGGALYDSSPGTTARRSLPGSPQMSPSAYWQNGAPGNAQVQGMQARGPYSPSMSQGSPRGMPPSFVQKYEHAPQHAGQGVYGAAPPPPQQQHQQQQGQQQGQGQGQARYSPQQHYAPQSRVQTQGLSVQPPVYPRYSPPTQYGQLTLSPSHLQQQQLQQGQGQGQGQGSPHGSHGPGSPYFPPRSPSQPHQQALQQQVQQQQVQQQQVQGMNHHRAHQHQVQGQGQAQAYVPQGQNPGHHQGQSQGQGQGYNPQSREFHPQNNSYERSHAQTYNNPPNSNSSAGANGAANNAAHPVYNDFSLDLGLPELSQNNNREGLIREDYFGASNNNTSNGWFPPTDLPQM